MILDTFKSLLEVAWNLCKYPTYILIVVLILFLLSYRTWYLYLKYHDNLQPLPNNGGHVRLKKDNIVKKLWLASKQLALDRLTMDPSRFRPKSGRIVCFVGRQGRGKTIAATRMLMDLQAEWPKLKVATNYEYEHQDYEINHWEQLVDLQNGAQGMAIALDEAQLWFNGRDFRNFDINMLQEIVFQRKQNKMLLLTTQVFSALDKNIKTQVQEIHYCTTILGVFTIVRVKEPDINSSDGTIEKEHFRRIYCFPHTPELRNAYDTFKMIDNLKKKGFVDRSEQLGRVSTENNINVQIDKKLKKK